MEQFDLLRYVAGAIEGMGLRYFVTGSTATIFYGEPRFSNDIDVVVELTQRQVEDFCRRFPPAEFYVSEAVTNKASRKNNLSNFISPAQLPRR